MHVHYVPIQVPRTPTRAAGYDENTQSGQQVRKSRLVKHKGIQACKNLRRKSLPCLVLASSCFSVCLLLAATLASLAWPATPKPCSVPASAFIRKPQVPPRRGVLTALAGRRELLERSEDFFVQPFCMPCRSARHKPLPASCQRHRPTQTFRVQRGLEACENFSSWFACFSNTPTRVACVSHVCHSQVVLWVSTQCVPDHPAAGILNSK